MQEASLRQRGTRATLHAVGEPHGWRDVRHTVATPDNAARHAGTAMHDYTRTSLRGCINMHRNPEIPPFPRTTVLPAANTRFLRTSRKSLTIIGLRFFMPQKTPYGFAEEPFPHCGTGFFIRRQLMWRELNITKTAYENNRSMIPERPRRNALSISRIYFVNIFYHKNAYLCIPIIHVPEYSPSVCPCRSLQYARQTTVCRDSVHHLIMRGNL